MEELTDSQARELLDRADVAHLGVVAEGEPYVTAVSFVVSGNNLLFRTGPGRRLRAIQAGSPVCIEASEYDPESGDWVSVVAIGPASVIDDATVESGTIAALRRKYSKALDAITLGTDEHAVAVAVMLSRISGRSSGRAWAPRTRPGRL